MRRKDGDVFVADKDNFHSLIAGEGLIFVKFFAPWCGHCKKMIWDFREAATELKGKATLVELDATVERDLAKKYEIRGFPVLKLFSKGEVISDYKGDRIKEDFIKYIDRALLPYAVECADADELAKFVADNKGKALFIAAKLDKLKSVFRKTSMSLRDVSPDSVAFASVEDTAFLKELAGKDLEADSVLLVRDDESTDVFSDDADAFEQWASVGSLPLYAEFSRDNAGLYTKLDKPVFILFQDPEKKYKDVNDDITEIAKPYRSSGALVFTWTNRVDLKSFAEHVGVADKDPAIVIYEFKSDQKYVFSGDYSKEALKAWIDKFVTGDVSAAIKSAPIPETNDEPVKIIVGDTWTEIVEDESKDVLIEQYAPWCGHCKKLAPILDELASDLKGVETLVIAKMDATANDAPKEYKTRGYPTLHFFAAGSKTGVPYEGGRSKEDFVKFLKENATHKGGF
ncbi:Protein disulfide-isomerase [Gracilariopsis chorda]|uniref:Protein disulfide-isomerase n=1 Tax=Gracilariopsis chorda TaxID=448386 RepID=A0A2V3IQY8_9FLOR|nr:Protein disulfide-isomerase [Gracilariopsis chorda]|eukprot:PXF43570.1 Protein disulfide-isomerase [Gracilariopsis chorda]